VRRGEVWYADQPEPYKARPVVLVGRDESYQVRTHVLVVPVTTRRRALPTEVTLGARNGLRHASVANCDTIQLMPLARLDRQLGVLERDQLTALDKALRYALALD
jgi:mRNA-degrading endonuclease toxin of MazEF toxin-antitoxin module